MESVVAYLGELRDGQHISRAQLAAMLETTEQTIFRIERGQQEPKGGLLVGLVTMLRGSWDEIRRLQLGKDATPDLGRDLARQRLQRLRTAQDRIEVLMEEEPAVLLETIRQATAQLERRIGGRIAPDANGG